MLPPLRLPALRTWWSVLATVLGLLALATAARAQVIVVAGTSSGGITQALTSMNVSYTNAGSIVNPNPSTYGLGRGDIIIISNDGGSAPFFDYNNFLNAGGH